MDASLPKINRERLVLSRLRGGDYAHAGDKEAMDIVIKRVLQIDPAIVSGPSLDVGSGFGGTAEHFRKRGFKHLWGIDKDKAAVRYAKEHYLEISFISGDANAAPTFFEPDFFSFIYSFNVLYAIEDKEGLLKKLSDVAKPGAILALFDYTQKNDAFHGINDLAGQKMRPIRMEGLKEKWAILGWSIVEIEDVSDSYIKWYEGLLEKLSREKPSLLQEFSLEEIGRVESGFTILLSHLKGSSLGGAIIYARKSS